jgi:hypothetical protein
VQGEYVRRGETEGREGIGEEGRSRGKKGNR